MKQDVLNTIAFLTEQYNQDMNDSQLDFWIDALEEYHPASLRKAAVEIVKRQKWMPKLSEFIDLVQRAEETGPAADVLNWTYAMILLGRNLRGEISDAELERNDSWKWFMARQPAFDLNDPVLIKSDEEVRQWMLEDALVVAA